MKHSDTLAKIAPALVAALAEIGSVAKDAKNASFGGFKYATLENVIDTAKPHLTAHKLAVFQLPGALVDGVLTIETVIMHESGEWVSGDFGIQLGKADPQGVGSAVSYGRRYSLMAALNMPAVDDDGEAAMGRPAASAAPAKPKSSYAAKQDGTGERFKTILAEIHSLESPTAVAAFLGGRTAEIAKMPEGWRTELREKLEEQKEIIRQQAEVSDFPGDRRERVAGVDADAVN